MSEPTTKKGANSTVLTVIIIVLATLLVGAIAFICVTLFGGQNTNEEKDGDDSGTSNTIQETVLDEETRKLYDTVVLTLDGQEIDYELYRYYYLSCKDSMDGGDSNFWTTSEGASAKEELKENVLTELKYEAAIRALCKTYNLSLSEEEIQEVEEGVETTASLVEMSYGVSMDTMLSSYHMTKASFTELRLFETLADKLYQYLMEEENGVLDFSEEAVTESAKEFFAVKHILVGYDDDLSAEEAKASAEGLLKTLRAITDFDEMEKEFDTLMEKHSNDYVEDGDNFYYYTEGEMDEDFEKAAAATEVGTLSDVVKSQFGYHIILRLPLDMEYFKENVYVNYAYRDFVESGMDAVEVVESELYSTLTPETAK